MRKRGIVVICFMSLAYASGYQVRFACKILFKTFGVPELRAETLGEFRYDSEVVLTCAESSNSSGGVSRICRRSSNESRCIVCPIL
jgi:hypothetical protein